MPGTGRGGQILASGPREGAPLYKALLFIAAAENGWCAPINSNCTSWILSCLEEKPISGNPSLSRG